MNHKSTIEQRFSHLAGCCCYCLLPLLLTITVTGCTSFGSNNISPDRFNYNEAIGRSADEQMLLNLLRIRYKQVPVFLSVSSVLTQYTYMASAGVNGQSGTSLGSSANFIGANSTIRYIEKPTITYTPLSGAEFTHQLISPIPDGRVFSLVQSGWPPDLLLGLAIEMIGHLPNLPFYREPSAEDLEAHEEFRQAINLMIHLSKFRLVEVRRNESATDNEHTPDYLVFSETNHQPHRDLILKFKTLLNLSPSIHRFRITRKITHVEPDEITVRIRSMISLMGLLSRGVEIPDTHLAESRTQDSYYSTNSKLTPTLRVRHSIDPPINAYVAVQYGGYWFFISHKDQESKEAFGLISYLFQMQAPQAPAVTPLITLPAG